MGDGATRPNPRIANSKWLPNTLLKPDERLPPHHHKPEADHENTNNQSCATDCNFKHVWRLGSHIQSLLEKAMQGCANFFRSQDPQSRKEGYIDSLASGAPGAR